MTVGERIKQKRIELNMSQDELAKKVGYKSRSSIQKIENARRLPLPKVEKMALALGCTPSQLMGWENGVAVTEPCTAHFVHLPDYSEEEQAAIAFYEKYKNAPPDVQSVVERLLKNP